MKSAKKKLVEKKYIPDRRVGDMKRLFSNDKDIKAEIEKETKRSVDARLHIIETRLDHIDKITDGRGVVLRQLSTEHAAFGREIESLRGMIGSLKDDLIISFESHMKTEAQERVIQVRRAFWALLTILITSVITLGSSMLGGLGVFE